MNALKTYFPNLNALRFFAAFAVCMFHMSYLFDWSPGMITKWGLILLTLDGFSGTAGVDFFFTLSGFLITYLMYQEETSSSFSIGNFYVRRLLRIWPLYFVTLFIGFVIYPNFSTIENFKETANWGMYVLFLSNFDALYFAKAQCDILAVHWSIAVEEQFYLIWPWIFLYSRKNIFPVICCGLILASLIYRIHGGHGFHTLTAMNALAFGALLAYGSFFYLQNVISILTRIQRPMVFFIYVAGFLLMLGNFQIVKQFPWYGGFDHFVNALFFGFILMEQNYSPHSFYKFGSFKVFGWLGTISYGIYLLHMVAIYLILGINSKFPMSGFVNTGLALMLTIGLSHISYQYLERPFLKLKEKF